MNPRTFVISNNIKFSHCVYTVIPVIDRQLLDLPYHLRRLRQSFFAADPGSNSLDPLIFNDFIAEACLKSITSNPSTDGLLTICVGSKSDVDDEIRHRHGRARCCADSYLHTMQNSFLFESKSDLKVDLQEDVRERDLTIKSASWPTERTRMESRRPLGVAETIMYKTDPSSELKSSSSEGIFNQIDFNIVVDGKPSTMMLSEGQLRLF